MGTHCGDSIPPSGASSNNEVFIIFHSDGTNIEAYAGFKMEYNPTGKQITTIQNNTEYHIDTKMQNFGYILQIRPMPKVANKRGVGLKNL